MNSGCGLMLLFTALAIWCATDFLIVINNI